MPDKEETDMHFPRPTVPVKMVGLEPEAVRKHRAVEEQFKHRSQSIIFAVAVGAWLVIILLGRLFGFEGHP